MNYVFASLIVVITKYAIGEIKKEASRKRKSFDVLVAIDWIFAVLIAIHGIMWMIKLLL